MKTLAIASKRDSSQSPNPAGTLLALMPVALSMAQEAAPCDGAAPYRRGGWLPKDMTFGSLTVLTLCETLLPSQRFSESSPSHVFPFSEPVV